MRNDSTSYEETDMTDWTPDEKHVARDLLGYYGYPGGYAPGGFTTVLIHALERADMWNTERLLMGFPHWRRPLEVLRTEGGNVLSQRLEGDG